MTIVMSAIVTRVELLASGCHCWLIILNPTPIVPQYEYWICSKPNWFLFGVHPSPNLQHLYITTELVQLGNFVNDLGWTLIPWCLSCSPGPGEVLSASMSLSSVPPISSSGVVSEIPESYPEFLESSGFSNSNSLESTEYC